jgi:hypothetical protein
MHIGFELFSPARGGAHEKLTTSDGGACRHKTCLPALADQHGGLTARKSTKLWQSASIWPIVYVPIQAIWIFGPIRLRQK